MNEQIQRLLTKAAELYAQGQAIVDEYAEKEWPADKRAEAEKLFNEAIDLTQKAETLKKGDALKSKLQTPDESKRLNTPGSGVAGGDADGKGDGDGNEGQGRQSAEYKAFLDVLSGAKGSQKIGFRQGDERKALQANLADQGGYLVAPQQFVAELVQSVKDMVVIEQIARVFTLTKAQSLGAPSLDTDLNDADWTSEVSTPSEDTALRTGKRELNPSQLQKLVKMSKTLLRIATVDPDQLVRERIAYKFGVTKEKGFLIGTGVNQPLGVFTASSSGISTARDTAAASATNIVGDDMIKTKMALKPQYHARPSTRWILHRDALLKLMLEKANTAGTYMFLPSLAGGVPDRILDIPYVLSEYAPNTFTTGKYVAILGDFNFYWIANALELDIQVLVELYALSNMVGYLATLWSDGMPVLEEAFVRLKLA